MTIKRALSKSPTTPGNGSNLGGRSANINFVRLERYLRNNVHLARGATLHGNTTERGRIKVDNVGAISVGINRKDEIRMVQKVDCRALNLEPDSFRDPEPLSNTQVEIEVARTIEAVDREISECTRRRSRHQIWLKRRRRSLASFWTYGYVKEHRIDKEHTLWCLVEPNTVPKLLEGKTGELRPVIGRGLIECRPAGGHVEWRASCPGSDKTNGE